MENAPSHIGLPSPNFPHKSYITYEKRPIDIIFFPMKYNGMKLIHFHETCKKLLNCNKHYWL